MFLLAACGPAPAPVTLRAGWTADPDSLNPGVALSEEAYYVLNMVYDSLYQHNLDGTDTLELAKSVDTSEDGKVWTFELRDGVKFHDGSPLTAEDVVFSFDLYKNHPDDFPYMPGYTAYFESVEATSATTVKISLTEPIPNMESQLYYLYVLPRHIWEPLEREGQAASFENAEMIGSGPFKMGEYKKGESLRLIANKEHYLYHPKMDEVLFLNYGGDEGAVEGIKKGEVDVIFNVPLADAADLGQAQGINVVAGRPYAPVVSDILINQADPENCPTDSGGVCSGHPALRDLNLRKALAYATDKDKIVQEVMFGLAEPGLTLIPSGLGAFYNAKLQDYPYDVAQAQKILEDAGYEDSDGDGILEMPDGQPLQFRLELADDNASDAAEATLLQEMWRRIGVEVTPEAIPTDELYSRCCPKYDYDLQIGHWGSDPDPSFLLSVPLTSSIPSGLNETSYANPAYDALYDKQATDLDLSQRQADIWSMQEMMLNDVTYIIPYYPKNVQAYREDRFVGWLIDMPTLGLQDMPSMVALTPLR
jgi:peptide/nickel transport system substrate-binding protein